MDIFILDAGANILRFRKAQDIAGNNIWILYTANDKTR
jgi:hypothetical protein